MLNTLVMSLCPQSFLSSFLPPDLNLQRAVKLLHLIVLQNEHAQMPMLHVDMSVYLDGSVPYGSELQMPEMLGLSLPSWLLLREPQLLTFDSFSFLFNLLDSSSTSFLKCFLVCSGRIVVSLVQNIVFCERVYVHWKACWFTGFNHLLFFLSCMLVDALRYSCLSCITGSNRTSRCARACRTKGRESE